MLNLFYERNSYYQPVQLLQCVYHPTSPTPFTVNRFPHYFYPNPDLYIFQGFVGSSLMLCLTMIQLALQDIPVEYVASGRRGGCICCQCGCSRVGDSQWCSNNFVIVEIMSFPLGLIMHLRWANFHLLKSNTLWCTHLARTCHKPPVIA